MDNGGRDTRFKLALKEFEAAKLSEASFFLVKFFFWINYYLLIG